MYIPAAFREDDIGILHDLIETYSFATLVSTCAGAPFASHLPFLLDRDRGEHGTLRTHLARGNPQWNAWADVDATDEAMVIFQGPHAYISPSWYENEPNVPTWNYAVVHAYGKPRLMTDDELLATLDDTVAFFESGRPAPWSTATLSDEYIGKVMRGIVGVEIPITRLEGKFKLSQNRQPEDALGAIRGLMADGDPPGVATAGLMRGRMAPATDAYVPAVSLFPQS